MNFQLDENIINAINKDELVFFVGAGLSVAAGFPSYQELITFILTNIKDKGIQVQDAYESFQSGGMTYLDILNRVKHRKDEVLQLISQKLKVSSLEKSNLTLQRKLWNITNKIITSNYDDALETTAPSNIKVVQHYHSGLKSQISKSSGYLLKLYGSIEDPTQIIFFEDDYERMYGNRTPIISEFINILCKKTVVFIGVNINDYYIRKALKDAYNSVGRTHFAISIKDADSEFFRGYGVNIIKIKDFSEINFILDNFIKVKSTSNSSEISGSINITTNGEDNTSTYENSKKSAKSPYNSIYINDIQGIKPALGVDTLAEELTHILRNMENEKGMMLGIFGKWGRGKSFLMERIWHRLESEGEKNPFYRVNFHAWKYQDTPGIWAYLYEAFANQYYGSKNKPLRVAKHNFKRLGLFPVLRFILTLIAMISWYFLIGTDQKIKLAYKLFSIFGLGGLIGLYSIYSKQRLQAVELIKKLSEKHSYKPLLGFQSDIQEELKKLLKTWIPKKDLDKNKRILLFVEDIDRCSEDKLIQIIDSLRVMLEEDEIYQRVVVITSCDERILKRAIKYKYSKYLNDDEKASKSFDIEDISNEYLDKLFIMGIKLGKLTESETREMFDVYTLSRGKVAPQPKEEDDDNKKPSQEQEANLSELDKNKGYASAPPVGTDMITDIDNVTQNLANEDVSKEYELSYEEYNMLIGCLRLVPNITPRQIRVLYYRYLVARNLLRLRLKEINKLSYWEEEADQTILPNILIEYSFSHSKESFANVINKISLQEDDEYTYESNGIEIRLEKSIFVEIYRILEIVIAY